MLLRAGAPGACRARCRRGAIGRRSCNRGWLAGDLARDQVGAIVAQVSTPALVSLAAVEAEPSDAPRCRRRLRRRRRRPIHRRSPATRPRDRGRIGRTRLDADAGGGAGAAWSLTLGVDHRRCFRETATNGSGPVRAFGTWSFSAGLRRTIRRPDLGAALDVGPDMALAGVRGSIDFMGIAVLLGGGRRFGRLFVEATGGVGPGGVSIDGHRAKPILVGPRRYRKPKFLHVRPRALPPGTSDRRAGAVEVLRPDGERRRTSRHRGPTGRLPDQLARGEVSLLVTAARRERALSCHGATHESFTLGRPNGSARSTRVRHRDRVR